jgi:hypothetical protein
MTEALNIVKLYKRLLQDRHVTVWHISLLSAIIFLYALNSGLTYIEVSRKQLMKLAHINSIATYHKYIYQLQDLGYIVYSPTYNYYDRSKIQIVNQ